MMETEKQITCTGMSLHNKMQTLRLELQEAVPGQSWPKIYTRDITLDDVKATNIRVVRNKEGELIHQNPVFISGHFRAIVVGNICAMMATDYYPERKPQAFLKAVASAKLAAESLMKSANIDANLKALETATRNVREKMKSPEYSPAAVALYMSVRETLSSFGSTEGDKDYDDE